MKKKMLTLTAAAVLALASVTGVAAGWTADPGPDPDRCAGWQESGSHRFDLYNCVFVEDEANSGSSGGVGTIR